MAKVTIEDISQQTGLSRGTVSRALNDRPDISAQTKQRVLEVCRKRNFSPSHAARALATGRSFAVAVLLDDLQSVCAASFLRGVVNRAQSARYAVHVAELGPDPEQQQDAIRAIVGERIDGVLVAAPLDPAAVPVLREALEKRPLVTCAPIDGTPADVLTPDETESGRLVARHLFQNGSQQVLMVHRREPATANRLVGFQQVCREHGIDPESITIELSAGQPLDSETADQIASRLSGVSALAATDDFLAVDLMGVCLRADRHPGRDIAVMGQGNERVGARIAPTLSTTDFCSEEIGRRAMETSLQRIQKSRMDAPQSALIPPLLIIRESTQMLM